MNSEPNLEPEKPAIFTPVSAEEITPTSEIADAHTSEIVAQPEAHINQAAVLSDQTSETPAPMAQAVEALVQNPHLPSQSVEPPAQPDIPTPETAAHLAVSFLPPPRAPFQSSLSLSLVCASPTAQIFYALGTHELGENALIFDPKEKIHLTAPTDIVAQAIENGVRGPLLTGTFEIKKALWEEKEPLDQSDATPHKYGENHTTEDGWRLCGGSVRGKLHAHRALWREDSFAIAETRQGTAIWEIIAVSDGAGSAPLSRVGSRLACDTAIDFLKVELAKLPALPDEKAELGSALLPLRVALTGAAQTALEAIRREAAQRNQPVSAFAATLLILVRREWNGEQLCASLQVGDGAIALLDGANDFKIFGVADHGQHSSETRFLTTKGVEAEFAHRFQVTLRPDLRAVLLVSDGVSDDYFPEDKRIGEVFEAVLPLVQNAEDGGGEIVKWLGYEKKGSSDDRTLVISWRDAPANITAMALPHEAENEVKNGDSDRDT